MGIIALEGLEFFAYHGAYVEEQKIGNRYAVDIFITTDFTTAAETDRLKETVNYEEVYASIKEVMHQKHRLLEHIGHSIIGKIRSQYPYIQLVEVSVSKFNPPIGGVCERARITIKG
ncbi:MAG: dihydroneopterin aldolase [Bacteroidota bacterium]